MIISHYRGLDSKCTYACCKTLQFTCFRELNTKLNQ